MLYKMTLAITYSIDIVVILQQAFIPVGGVASKWFINCISSSDSMSVVGGNDLGTMKTCLRIDVYVMRPNQRNDYIVQ